jgi:hypothetical protein
MGRILPEEGVESPGGKCGVGWRIRGRSSREEDMEELAKMFDEKATRGKCKALLQY